MRTYTIREHMGFSRNGPARDGVVPLPERTFDQLEQFILSNRTGEGGAEPLELMSLGASPGLGKVITARNYVGVILTRDGTEIEILPKVELSGDGSDAAVRRIFLAMLRTVQEAPFKTFQTARLDTARMRLLELFVRMFLEEAQRLVRRGLKGGYAAVRGDERYVKGRILFSEQLRRNLCHRERVFVEHDVFSVDRPENRLVKSTALYLQRHTADGANRRDLRTLLALLEPVPESRNIQRDFSQCGQTRAMADYRRVLELCRVFLRGLSFTAFSGSQAALALLFPMERVFESYVAAVLRQGLDRERYQLRIQDRGKYLFDLPWRQFALRPDLVVTDTRSGARTVLDTKWKLLSPQWRGCGISQGDMYQMCAYQREYGAGQAVLLYPSCAAMEGLEEAVEYSSESGNLVRVRMMDLQSPERMTRAVERIL